MSYDYISRVAKQLKQKYHESDPFKISEAMKITVLFVPMGTYKGACKGFFMIQSRKKVITVNSDLPKSLQKIIASHELGHAVLHSKAVGINTFHDFELFDSASTLEYEANIFSAEFLMDDEDVLQKLNDDISFFAAAALLRVPPELLDFKFRMLKRKGYKVIDPPLMANGDFLKNIETNIVENY